MKYINIISLLALCVVFTPDYFFNKNTKYEIDSKYCDPQSSIYLQQKEKPVILDNKDIKLPKSRPKYIEID